MQNTLWFYNIWEVFDVVVLILCITFSKPDYSFISANFATYLQPIPLHATVESTGHCSKAKLDPGNLDWISPYLPKLYVSIKHMWGWSTAFLLLAVFMIWKNKCVAASFPKTYQLTASVLTCKEPIYPWIEGTAFVIMSFICHSYIWFCYWIAIFWKKVRILVFLFPLAYLFYWFLGWMIFFKERSVEAKFQRHVYLN